MTAGPEGPEGLPVPLPPLEAVLLRSRAEALAALRRAGWRPYATPIHLDAGRERLLNIDLGEPDLAFHDAGGDVAAVARLESDRAGQVVLLEITGAAPVDPGRLAAALLPDPGEPRVGGGPDAREWVWGPESGAAARIGDEPVRLWVCAERAYGGRLWAVASVVRRG